MLFIEDVHLTLEGYSFLLQLICKRMRLMDTFFSKSFDVLCKDGKNIVEAF